MHVALVAQYFWPESVGAGVWLHQLATNLVRRGHRVTLVTAFPNYPQGRVFPGYRGKLLMRESMDGVEIVRCYIYATPSKAFWPRAVSFASFCASALVGGLLVRRLDVIYGILPPLPLGLTAEFVGLAKRAPVVVNLQDIYPDLAITLGYLRNPIAIKFFQRLEKLIYRYAAAIVVISESFREKLLRKGVPAEKIHLIPNWADAEEIQPAPRDNAFRRQLGLKNDFTVIYSGSLSHNTRLDTVVEAARLLDGEPYQFVFVGDGVHKQGLEARARVYGLKNLRFLPFQPFEVYPRVLAASDIQLVSLNAAASEMSLPSKVYKIMASGRPILALAQAESDLCRLVERAECGVAVDPNDPAAVAAALRGLAASRESLERMGRNARAYLVEHFDRNRCVAQVESVLEQVANG